MKLLWLLWTITFLENDFPLFFTKPLQNEQAVVFFSPHLVPISKRSLVQVNPADPPWFIVPCTRSSPCLGAAGAGPG